MKKLEELEMAIASLSDEEYREFRHWFLFYFLISSKRAL